MAPLTITHLFTHSEVTHGGAVQGLLLARALQERGHLVLCFFHLPWLPHERVDIVHAHRSLALLLGFFTSVCHNQRGLVVNRGTTYALPNRLESEGYHSSRLDPVIEVTEPVNLHSAVDKRRFG